MITMVGIIVAAAGLFLIAGSLFNWDWYWERRRTRVWVDLFGRTGARVAYGIVGLALLVSGVLIAAGVIAI
jgi:hypothetical protein